MILNSNISIVEMFRYPLLVPLAAILICSLLGSVIAVFLSGFLAVVFALTLSFEREGFIY